LKILFLADLNSAHVIKWTCALSARGHEVGIFTLNRADKPWYSDLPRVSVFGDSIVGREVFGKAVWSKLSYLKARKELSRVISSFRPDIVHAHYASSYGLLGAISGFHPFAISSWGSDVMDFPNRSVMHRMLLRNNFKKADLLLATGQTIADCVHALSSRPVVIIPFGIDLNVFHPAPRGLGYTPNDIVVGTVKALEPVYGIDILIKAFAEVSKSRPRLSLKLLIAGGGSRMEEYVKLTKTLRIDNQTQFAGRIEFGDVPRYHQAIDVFANLSLNESFGVSVLEASASGKPAVVSTAGGLKEVILPGTTGIAVQPGDVKSAAEAIATLVDDPTLRKKMGEAGIRFVADTYNWADCVLKMEAAYKQLLGSKASGNE
jgi:glycosyltransferase involved in cell wall biosynthesis